MIKYILILLVSISFGLTSCNETTTNDSEKITTSAKEQPLFVGAWVLDKMNLSGEMVRGDVMGYPTYSFNGDNTYVIRAGAQVEQGTWVLNSKQLTLNSKQNKETKLSIIESTDAIFTYEVGVDSKTIVFLIKDE